MIYEPHVGPLSLLTVRTLLRVRRFGGAHVRVFADSNGFQLCWSSGRGVNEIGTMCASSKAAETQLKIHMRRVRQSLRAHSCVDKLILSGGGELATCPLFNRFAVAVVLRDDERSRRQ